MDKAEAIELLRCHSFAHPDLRHPRMTNGFLGILRPFQGKLIEENYHEVMACLRCLASELQREGQVDKDVVSSLWAICHFARAWGLEEDGMLRRNGLITDEQIRQLSEWVDAISYATMMLLDGSDVDAAFDEYRDQDKKP